MKNKKHLNDIYLFFCFRLCFFYIFLTFLFIFHIYGLVLFFTEFFLYRCISLSINELIIIYYKKTKAILKFQKQITFRKKIYNYKYFVSLKTIILFQIFFKITNNLGDN